MDHLKKESVIVQDSRGPAIKLGGSSAGFKDSSERKIGRRTNIIIKEDEMARKKGKSISFDAMVKFFMMNYDIPSRKDIQKILIRLDNLETLIRNSGFSQKSGRFVAGEGKGRSSRSVKTAFEVVYDAIKSVEHGADFAEIQAKTGFGEKKIRNIIFRLNKFGRIKRKNRGVYIAV